MNQNPMYALALGGVAAVIAIVALVLAVGASGGDADEGSDVDAIVAAQNADIAALTNEISGLQAALSAVEGGASQSDLAALSASIDSLEADAADAEELIGSLEDSLNEAMSMEEDLLMELLSAFDEMDFMEFMEFEEGDLVDDDVYELMEADLRAVIADVLAMEAADEDDDADEDALAELNAAIDELRADIDAADSSADVSELAERLDWLDQAAAPAYTKAYVQEAIRRYETDGRAATLDYYNTMDSVSGDLYLFVLDENFEIIVHPTVPSNIGLDVRGPLGTDTTGYNFGAEFITATEAGKWVDYVYLNPADDFEHERKHSYLVKHENLIFGSGWYDRDIALEEEDPEAYTVAYVNQAIARYDANGLDAIIEYYNDEESINGQWYMFIVGEDDNFVAHAATPERLGTDVKVLTDANGYAHGKAIAEATEEGGWLDYTRINPVSGLDEPKHSWIIRHDGLIFGSGYYDGDTDDSPAALTQDFVRQAIARYDADGREAALAYYNTMDSVDGDLYLFVLDEDFEILVHPTVPSNIGLSVKGPFGVDITGYDFGAEFITTTEAGKWVDYVYLNPVDDFMHERKHSYLVKHDDLIFGSGWYDRDIELDQEDPEAYTIAYVNQAIARYDAEGRDAVLEYYNDEENIDGPWYVFIIDADDKMIAHAPIPSLLGTDVKELVSSDGYELGKEMAKATEEGGWINYLWPNPATATDEEEPKRTWVRRQDGLIFGSGYYGDTDGNPVALTRDFVRQAIARYEADGREATLDYYNTMDSVDGDLYLFVLDEDFEIIVHPTVPSNIGLDVRGPFGTDITGYDFGAEFVTATEAGKWVDYVYLNPVDDFMHERKHSYLVKHDDLIFGSGWYDRDIELEQEDPEAYTLAYVRQAIARYDTEGLGAVLERYNDPASVNGQWYVFIVGADDNFLAHAATPERLGTDVKVLTDANGYAHGKAIAEATKEGGWLNYTRVNPVSGLDEPKHSWVIRHDGLIFGSGYYTE